MINVHEAKDRLLKFCKEWRLMRGSDPECPYSLHAGSDREAHLYTADIEAVCEALSDPARDKKGDVIVTVFDKKDAFWHTHDYGNRSKLVAENETHLVIKVPGQTYASGQFRPYAPASTVLLKIEEKRDWKENAKWYRCSQVMWWTKDGAL